MGALEWLGFGVKKKSIQVQDQQTIRLVFNGELGGYRPLVYFSDNTETYIEKGFLGNHVVFTITDWVGRKMASIDPLVYKIKSKKDAKKYNLFQKNFNPHNSIRIAQLKKKAFDVEEIEGEHPLKSVLERPNPFQTWDEFIYGYLVYKKFTGRCYIKGVKVENSTRTKGYQELYLLPSQYIEAVSGEGSTVISHYRDSRVPDEKILTEDVCIIKTFSPVDGGMNGTSIFKSASKLLTKSSDALDAETETMQNRGAKKIVFPNLAPREMADLPSMQGVQQDQVSEKLRKSIKEAGNNGIALNAIPLGSIDLGLSPVDLNILQSKQHDEKAWCSLFHVSSMVVLNDHESASYDTMQQNMVLSVSNGVIPELEALKNALNSWLVPSHDPSLYIDFDYTEFPEMYKEIFDVAKELKNTEVVTVDEIRAVIKYDNYEGENGNKILVSGNKKILDDIQYDLPQVGGDNMNL